MAWQQRDYYSLLGVGRGASAAEIDRAYRRAARATHPDVHPDDDSAAERFPAVTIAYETLSDADRRASYDHAHPRVRPANPVRVVVHGRTHPSVVAPVELGRRRPRPEPLQRLRSGSANAPLADDLFELATAVSRLLGSWPFP